MVLVSIVVMGIALAGMMILSTPLPQHIPVLNVEVANTATTVYLTHNGGDPLPPGEYRIIADGQDRTTSFTKRGGSPPGSWVVGETLEYTPADRIIPASYQVVYTGTGIPVVIREIQI